MRFGFFFLLVLVCASQFFPLPSALVSALLSLQPTARPRLLRAEVGPLPWPPTEQGQAVVGHPVTGQRPWLGTGPYTHDVPLCLLRVVWPTWPVMRAQLHLASNARPYLFRYIRTANTPKPHPLDRRVSSYWTSSFPLNF